VITLKELQNWKLRNAGLVILSACETGVGSGLAKSGNELGSGVEVLGIGYQVQRAGAKAVIATLWQVSDEPQLSSWTISTASYANPTLPLQKP
jgi:CHAT domain-containing protein